MTTIWDFSSFSDGPSAGGVDRWCGRVGEFRQNCPSMQRRKALGGRNARGREVDASTTSQTTTKTVPCDAAMVLGAVCVVSDSFFL